MSAVIILAIIPILSMFICHAIAKKRDANVVRWVVLAACFGPLAIPFVFFAKPKVAST